MITLDVSPFEYNYYRNETVNHHDVEAESFYNLEPSKTLKTRRPGLFSSELLRDDMYKKHMQISDCDLCQ